MTSRPDFRMYNPHPNNLRAILAQAGLSAPAAAAMLGIPVRTMQRYVSKHVLMTKAFAPYPVQFALEQLAASRRKEHAMAARSAARRSALNVSQT